MLVPAARVDHELYYVHLLPCFPSVTIIQVYKSLCDCLCVCASTHAYYHITAQRLMATGTNSHTIPPRSSLSIVLSTPKKLEGADKSLLPNAATKHLHHTITSSSTSNNRLPEQNTITVLLPAFQARDPPLTSRSNTRSHPDPQGILPMRYLHHTVTPANKCTVKEHLPRSKMLESKDHLLLDYQGQLSILEGLNRRASKKMKRPR